MIRYVVRRVVVRRVVVAAAVVVVTGVALGVTAAPAAAHGVHRSGDSVLAYLNSGTLHMLLGWDHLLFIAGVALVSGRVKPAAKLLSLFAIGHSLTLVGATLAGWEVSAVLVDVVIALSLVFVGVAGWAGPPRPRRFAAAVFGFGLVHGLGLATRLQALALPEDGLLIRVIAFNVGVELAQLVAVLSAFVLWKLLLHRLDGTAFRRVSYGGLAAVGLAAAVVLTVTGLTPAQTPSSAAPARAAAPAVGSGAPQELPSPTPQEHQ